MPGEKKKQRSQDLDITNVGKLKLVERGTATKKVKASPPKKSAKTPSPGSRKTVISSQVPLGKNLETRIAQRAYEIHEERCRIGAPLQDWLRAEREILADYELEAKP